jgi:hypothetical protein
MLLRVDTALVGAGSVTARVGITVGGQEILLDFVINSGVAVGTIVGLTFSHLGTSMVASDGYVAMLDAGSTVNLRMTAAGTVTTAPVLTSHVVGFNLASI